MNKFIREYIKSVYVFTLGIFLFYFVHFFFKGWKSQIIIYFFLFLFTMLYSLLFVFFKFKFQKQRVLIDTVEIVIWVVIATGFLFSF